MATDNGGDRIKYQEKQSPYESKRNLVHVWGDWFLLSGGIFILVLTKRKWRSTFGYEKMKENKGAL